MKSEDGIKMDIRKIKNIKSDMIKIGRAMLDLGLQNTHSGNISVREGNDLFITKTGSMKGHLEALGMKSDMISRSLNEGFSGGEKKRNEILQMLILEPEVIILDEIDSGLDIDALRAVSEGINKMKDGKRTFLVITHYSRILDYIEPDYIHVLKEGKVIKTAGVELVAKLEADGYDGIVEE